MSNMKKQRTMELEIPEYRSQFAVKIAEVKRIFQTGVKVPSTNGRLRKSPSRSSSKSSVPLKWEVSLAQPLEPNRLFSTALTVVPPPLTHIGLQEDDRRLSTEEGNSDRIILKPTRSRERIKRLDNGVNLPMTDNSDPSSTTSSTSKSSSGIDEQKITDSMEMECDKVDCLDRQMPKLLTPRKVPLRFTLFPENCSPFMPVLKPATNVLETLPQKPGVRRSLTRRKSGDSDLNASSNASPSTSYSSLGSNSSVANQTRKVKNGNKGVKEDIKTKKSSNVPLKKNGRMTPPAGQISLRAYYYGRWHWGEVPAITVNSKKKRSIKANFESEFSRHPIWRTLMRTPVKCNLCPGEILKNTDVIPHMLEHIKEDGGRWEFTKRQQVISPKPQSLLSQCRLCFHKVECLLTTHMKEEHQHVSDISCRICEIAFFSIEDMISHHKKFHDVAEMPYCCPVCPCRTSSRWDLIRHFQNKHSKETEVLCPKCMASVDVGNSNGLLSLQLHLLAHKTDPEIACPRCSLRFVTKEDFQVHIGCHHTHPPDMFNETFSHPLLGFQCFVEEYKRNPVFMNNPRAILPAIPNGSVENPNCAHEDNGQKVTET